MQRVSLFIRKDKKDSLSQGLTREPASISYSHHWDTPVSGKFTLLDWYWLLEDEADDFNAHALSESCCSLLIQNCVDAYVTKFAIPYTVYKTQEEILQLFMLIKKYPDTLKVQTDDATVDLIEPTLCEIDSYACGFPQPIFDPLYSQPKASVRKTRFGQEIETPSDVSQHKPKESPTSTVISSANVASKNGKKYSKKRMLSSASIMRKRKTSGFTSNAGRKSKKIPPTTAKLMDSKKRISQDKDVSTDINVMVPITPRVSVTSEFAAIKIDTVHSLLAEQHLSRLKYLKHNKPLSGRATLQGPEIKTTIPSSITFDHLESSSFPFLRTKTGYSIKDIEIIKETTKVSAIKRIAVVPKKGFNNESSIKSSTASAAISHPYVYSMPPVSEKITNIGGAVLVRKDVRYKIPQMHDETSFEFELERKVQLKPISRGKVNPRLMVSELIDRIPGPIRIPKDLNPK